MMGETRMGMMRKNRLLRTGMTVLVALCVLLGGVAPVPSAALTMPVMVVRGPGHQSVPVAISAVAYQWDPFPGAAWYEVRLRDITLGDTGPLLVQNVLCKGLSYDVPDALLDPGKTYRFAVAPFNGAGVLISSGWTLWQTSTISSETAGSASGGFGMTGTEPPSFGPSSLTGSASSNGASNSVATGAEATGVPQGSASQANTAASPPDRVEDRFRPFLQADARWADAAYGDSTVRSSGCALLAVTNAVLYKIGRFLDPADLAADAGDCLVSGGTDVNRLLSRLTDARSGYRLSALRDAKGNIGMLDKADTKTLAAHLRTAGGFALVGTWVRPQGTPGHILSLVDVRDAPDGLEVLVLDSQPSALRGTKKTGMRWLPVSEFVGSDQVVRYRLLTAEAEQ